MQLLESRSQANAAWMEHQILDHLKDALRVILNWKVPTVGLSGKINSLQFTLKSFQRHLERLMILEEQDGYMLLVADTKPNMSQRVERLQEEHDLFRDMIQDILPEVETLTEFEKESFESACIKIGELLDKVDQHDTEEIQLLQETLLSDEGGEG